MKRILICWMLLAMLAGCGSGSSTESSAPAESAAPETTVETAEETAAETTAETAAEAGTEAAAADPASVTGEFTYWTYTDSANNLVNEFNKIYPNVKIDLQVFGGDEYKTKILTALQSGTDVPDVFDLEENYMYEFLDSDLIADLSYINVEDLVADYYEFQKAQMKDSNGNYKAMIFQSSPVAVWYLRDACEEWLGTSDPDEIAAMLSDWDAIIAKGEEIYEASGGTVHLWPNIAEMVKVEAFSFEPLVRDGVLNISDDWMNMIESMRTMYASTANAELGSWSSEWAAAWNEGTLLLRIMPSWDYFTDWDANAGNVGVAVPFKASYEGATGTCVYNNSENKEAAGVFLTYLASSEFQTVNMESYNQVPASKTVTDTLAEGFAAEDFGGQNTLATYSQICDKIEGITPDKYTRASQNLFQNAATNGIKEGKDNDAIIEDFKSELHDQYPEIVME